MRTASKFRAAIDNDYGERDRVFKGPWSKKNYVEYRLAMKRARIWITNQIIKDGWAFK